MRKSLMWLALGVLLAASTSALAVDTDGDGVDDAVDNCPFVINPGQEDADGGGVGDACAVCPNGDDDSDWGGDGVSCYQDNCWTLFNPVQNDADQDGVGNECDDCPMDPGNDPDGDDLCDGSSDACPTGFNLAGSSVIRLSQNLYGNNDVVAWASSPTGPEIAFAANIKQFADDPLLYLSSTGGGPPEPWSPVPDVSKVRFAPDGQHLVFQSESFTVDYGIWSVPVAGGPSVQLRPGWLIDEFFVTPGSERVISLKASPSGNPPYSMEIARVDGSDRVSIAPNVRNLDSVRVTPDGTTIVYLAMDGLWSVATDGGDPTLLAVGPLDIHTFELSPDGSTVAFEQVLVTGAYEQCIVPATGGEVVCLGVDSDPMQQGSISFTPDGARILYLSGPIVFYDLFSLPIDGGPRVRLNPPLPSGDSVESYRLSPDGAVAVYIAEQNVNNKDELFAIPVTGGLPLRLNGTIPDDEDVLDAVISPDGALVAYHVYRPGTEPDTIFTVSLGGGASTPLVDQEVGLESSLLFTPDAGTLLFRCDLEHGDDVAVCAYRPGESVQLLTPHVDEVDSLSALADSNTIAFRANYAELLTMELWAVHLEPDADGDGVWDPCEACPFDTGSDVDADGCGDADNCPTLPNADQSDLDADGLGDACDLCPTVAGAVPDSDGDFAGDPCDNCPGLPNPTQRDYDQDGYGDACDCAVGAAGVFDLPSEIGNLHFLADGETLAWDSGAPGAGPDISYDVVRGAVGHGPVGEPGATCVASEITDEFLYEPTVPPITGYYYVVRGGNYCGTGGYGTGTSGTPRETTVCP